MDISTTYGMIIFSHAQGVSEKDFDSANLEHADLRGASLEGADFSDACLRSADLSSADLYWAILYRADLGSANLQGAILRGADLKECNLRLANLRNADLGPDNLGGSTKLQGADLSSALIEGAKFSRATYDAKTSFPSGFNPALHLMLQVPSAT